MTIATANNVDDAEIAKFERMAPRWWDENGEFKPLHQMNPVRANFIDGASPVAEKTVLDVGCGGGILSEALAQRGAQVTGIDMGKDPLDVAKLHAQESNLSIQYYLSTAEQYAQTHPNEFDIVTCLEMLEHVPDPFSVIQSLYALAKPGGSVFLSTINRTPKAYAMAVIGAEYILKWLPKGTHDYKKFIRPSELGQWARAAGFTVSDLQGLTYNPILRRFSLSPHDVDVNYIMHLKK